MTRRGKKRGVSLAQLVMIGLGGVIGSGIFLASGEAVRAAGPAVLVAYGLGAFLVALTQSALVEMAVDRPAAGSFRVYAREELGPLFGFTTGWMYWTSGVVGMASEITAASLFTRYWLPGVPIWLLSLLYLAAVMVMNLGDTRGFGKVESYLSAIKVAALVGLVGIGLWLLFGPGGRGLGLYRQEPFMPAGWLGVAGSMLLVTFSMAGNSVVTIAAADTENPAQVMPRAVLTVLGVTSLLYVGAVFVLLGIVPWHQVPTGTSPFVSLLASAGLPAAPSVLNAVVLSAAVSALNSMVYACSRMLYSLAGDGSAPAFLRRRWANGAPGPATLFCGAAVLFALGLSGLLPGRAFLFLTSISSFVTLTNWTTIGLSHLHFRFRTGGNRQGAYRAPGYPFTTLLALAMVAAVALTAPLVPGQAAGLGVGAAAYVLWMGIYWLRERRGLPGRAPQGGARGRA